MAEHESAADATAAELATLLPRLPRVKITPETISQTIIDRWYGYETEYRQTIAELRAELAAANERAEKAEARLAKLGEAEIEQRIIGVSGVAHYAPTEWDLAHWHEWLPGVRLEEREVHPTPWRPAAHATGTALSASETDATPSEASGVELEFGKGAAGLSERCPCGCPKIGNGCNCHFCNEPYPTQQPDNDTTEDDRG
jgi:hypothetical protein